MKNTRRIDCEQLESRRYLSLAATVTEGDLIISGDANGTVEIRAVEAGKYEIVDNGEVITSVEGITDDIRVTLDSDGTATDDHVILNLNTQAVDEIFIATWPRQQHVRAAGWSHPRFVTLHGRFWR